MFSFYIENIYDRTEILEPEGWKDIQSVLKRDFSAHGMFFNYTDGTIKLGFSCDAVTELEAEYQTNGTEGYYLFEVDETEDNVTTTVFSGEIDFSTRIYNEDMWEAEVHSSSNQLLIKNRKKIKVNLNGGADLNNKGLNILNHLDIYSAAAKFNKTLEINGSETLPTQRSDTGGTGAYVYALIGLSNITSKELQKNNRIRSNTDEGPEFNWVTGDFLTLENDASLIMEFNHDIDIAVTAVSGSGNVSYAATLYLFYDQDLVSGDSGATGLPTTQRFISIDSDTISSAAYPNNGTLTLDTSATKYYQAFSQTGFSLRLEISMTGLSGGVSFDADITINSSSLTFTDKSPNFPTTSEWYNCHDALEKSLAFITGKNNFLYSNLLGDQLRGYDRNGCLSNMYITNGYNVRQITDTIKSPTLALNDHLKNINAIRPIGYGIEERPTDLRLGLKDVYWVGQSSTTATIRIYEDIDYEVNVGDTLTFKNHPVLYGTYEVSYIGWFAGLGYTAIDINIESNDQYYDVLGFENPSDGSWHYDVDVFTNSETNYEERLRVEDWVHFYSDNQLIDLGVVEEFREEPFNDAIYNEIQIGYSKYANDEDRANTLQEIAGKSIWALPTKKSDNTLNAIADWVSSTYIFQTVRDKLFSVKPTTSTRNDNDIFYCEKTTRKAYSVPVTFGSDYINFPEWVFENIMHINGAITITGASVGANNTNYFYGTGYGDYVHIIEDEIYKVDVSPSPNTVGADTVDIEYLVVTAQSYKMETDENILTSSNLTNSQYIHNQRRTPKRMLINWGRFIKSGIAYLVDMANRTIQNTSYDVNGEFTSEIDSYDLDSDCNTVWGDVQESANIDTDELQPIKFKPNIIHITKHICNTDYQNILDAHKNKLVYEEQNYGYITVTSPSDGKQVNGWLMKMTRNPLDKIAKLELLEKA